MIVTGPSLTSSTAIIAPRSLGEARAVASSRVGHAHHVDPNDSGARLDWQ